jgi:hypothetical protein
MGARSLDRNTASAFDVTVASPSPIARVAELPRRHAARRIRRHRRRPAEDVQIHETQGRRQRATRPGRPDDGAARIRVRPVGLDAYRALGASAKHAVQHLAHLHSEASSTTPATSKRLALQTNSVAPQSTDAKMIGSRRAPPPPGRTGTKRT